MLTKEATGRFYRDVELDAAGEWRFRLAGSGAVQASAEGRLFVRRQRA